MGKSQKSSKEVDELSKEISRDVTANGSTEGINEKDDRFQPSDLVDSLEDEGSPYDSGEDDQDASDYKSHSNAEESDSSEDEVQGSPYDSGEDDQDASDYKSLRSAEESDSSEDEVQGFSYDSGEDDQDASDYKSHRSAEESDSSEDEVPSRNTVGDVPLEWYKEEEHIGYDITGKKIKKRARKDRIESFLAGVDDAKNWRKIYDDYNDEEVELTKEEVKMIHRMLRGKTPHAGVDPYAPYVDWFEWEDKGHPLSNAPEPKRRFIPSKWEQKKVVRYIRAIRKGFLKFDKPKEEPHVYLLWGDDSTAAENKRHGLSYIPAPKPKLAGHEESYNPSVEFIPTQEEINSYQLMLEEDRPKFIPRRFESLRNVPAYENAIKETFDRCLDLYLCPRTRKKRINIDPESLKPKLPSLKDLRPYPSTCYLEYRGHTGPVKTISIDISGQWMASGSSDGTVRVWEIETSRCIKVWDVGEAVNHVTWNPLPELPILSISVGRDVLILDTRLANAENQARVKELLHVEESLLEEDEGNTTPVVRWVRDDKYDAIRLKHLKAVTTIDWHRKGDYFTTVVPSGHTRAILMHQLSKKHTHSPFQKLRGLPVTAVFHPTRSMFFISTKTHVWVYDLLKQKVVKKLETGLQEVSSISIHPGGDNVIVGSKEGKMCWFDMDLSSKPYKTLTSHHMKDITNVAFHRLYPLFASSSEDCTAYVFHGMVYSDLNQNPLIVPLKILRGHNSSKGRGVLDCKFHPRQPWLFTAGADSIIKLYCH
ncbi:ribosome biogenesis protein BOP1 homolog isoform X1 [Zingiber officinale]|uniref:ribosome biogenesis protein BOP1 homolog isoform X1 n=1 Tax=Zingiber officinale TaxID=94328 RepID=UPI001C4D2207|nr:ribosome biogenesis protein BOP1 homolog isoform X1 [Zingiber officinale]XP_042411797.1 ribosome biogenesis protein BOP1 homolog isoform X1 [Zingiber officinale]